MKKLYHVDAAASIADAELGLRMKEQAQMFGIPLNVEDTAIDTPLADGDEIKIGNGSLYVIATPGHSPGGICLYDKADGFLISGDTLFNGSIGRTDLPGGNHSQLIKSVKEKLLSLPGNTVVYPGHGPVTTIANERQHNPFLA